jgi:hypothetical protein
MGTHYEYGYSADVEGFFVTAGERIRLAKTNGCTFVLAELCELPPGAEGDLLVIVDGKADSRRVMLPEGVAQGQTLVKYKVTAYWSG